LRFTFVGCGSNVTSGASRAIVSSSTPASRNCDSRISGPVSRIAAPIRSATAGSILSAAAIGAAVAAENSPSCPRLLMLKRA
jgi:hypothetical protein